MTYLILQIWVGLLVTFILGVIFGYVMGKCSSSEECDTPQKKANDNKIVEIGSDFDSEDYAIETIEGIGKYTGERFRGAGISTVGDVLRQLNTPQKRQDFATKMDMKVSPVNEWAYQADIIRIESMDNQFAELVHLSGANNVEELAKQDVKKFTKKMCERNQSGRQLIAPIDPTEAQVKGWIKKAKKMQAIIQV